MNANQSNQKTWLSLLILAALVCGPSGVAAGPVSCSVSALRKLMALDAKAFAVREVELMGHSTEGGHIKILSRKGVPQRVHVELFGETGKLDAYLGYLNGDLMLIRRRTGYVESLPKVPVRVKKIETLTGFVCSGVVLIDRPQGREIGPEEAAEFAETPGWLLDALQSRGVDWKAPLPPKP